MYRRNVYVTTGLWLSPVARAALRALKTLKARATYMCMPKALFNRFARPTCRHSSLAKFGVISKLKPSPSNCCRKYTTLLHLLGVGVSFPQVVQAKKGTDLDMQTAAGVRAALTTALQAKPVLTSFPMHHTSTFHTLLV